MTQPLPGQLGFGRPPLDDVNVDLARRLADVESRLGALSSAVTMAANSANAAGLVVQSINQTVTTTLPAANAAFIRYNATSGFVVPANCTRLTWVVAMPLNFATAPTAGYSFAVSQAYSTDNVTWTNPPSITDASVDVSNVASGAQDSASSVTSGSATGFVPGSSVYWANEIAFNCAASASAVASIFGTLIWSRS